MTTDHNCHGCKWLDEVRTFDRGRPKRLGAGYCSQIKRLLSYRPGDSVRHETDPACELYEAGRFETRYEQKEQNNGSNDRSQAVELP